METSFRLHLLGSVLIEREGEPVTGFESRKALAILCYLAVQAKPVPREHLIDLFWPDKPLERGRNNLSRVLNNLATHCPDCLHADRNAVHFKPAPNVWLDVVELEHLIEQQDVISLSAAVALYRGKFMQGLYLDDCPDFELWTVREQERYQQWAANALNSLIAHFAQREDMHQTLKLNARLLEVTPWNEEAHRKMMLLHAHGGQRSAALKQFQTCRRVLAQQLEVEPCQETVLLYERIRDGQANPAAELNRLFAGQRRLLEHSYDLPSPAMPLLGRERERSALDKFLSDPACRLLCVVGPGGIGKTHLALHVARERRSSYPDGVCFVPLAAVASPRLLVLAFCDALKVFGFDHQDPKTHLLNFLRAKHMLLVVDNFEHLLEGAVLLAEILAAAPRVQLLVASRSRLNLEAEQVYELQGLGVPEADADEELERYDAVRLFVSIAQRAHPEFHLTSENRGDVVRLCQRMEGLPLGLKLAAPSTRTLSCGQILQQIDQSLDFLSTSQQDVPQRHRSLRAAFEHTWQLLSPHEQGVFAQLSIFRGGFTHEAFQAVTQVSLALLGGFCDKSLLHQSRLQRYQTHELLRQYAEEKLSANQVYWAHAHQRYAAYYAGFLHSREELLQGECQPQALEDIRAELQNIRHAWDNAVKLGDADFLDQALGGLCLFFIFTGGYQEGQWRCAEACAHLRAGEQGPVYTRLLIRQGAFSFHLGQHAQAQTLLESGLHLAKQLADEREQALALSALGEVAQATGAFEQARDRHQAALNMYRRVGDDAGSATSLNNLGNVAWSLGKYNEARDLHQQSLLLQRRRKDKRGIASSLNNLGAVAYHLKEYDSSKQLFEEGLALRRELGDRLGIAAGLNNLGEVARQLGDVEGARRLHREALAVRTEIGDQVGVAYSHNNLGDVERDLGHLSAARQAYREAILMGLEVQAHAAVLYMLAGYGALLLQEGNLKQAAELLGFIEHDPACSDDTRQRCASLRRDLESHLPQEELASALREGQVKTLEQVVCSITG